MPCRSWFTRRTESRSRTSSSPAGVLAPLNHRSSLRSEIPSTPASSLVEAPVRSFNQRATSRPERSSLTAEPLGQGADQLANAGGQLLALREDRARILELALQRGKFLEVDRYGRHRHSSQSCRF